MLNLVILQFARAVPPALGPVIRHEECAVALDAYLATDHRYFNYSLSLPECATTDSISLETKRCNLNLCNPSTKLHVDSFPCLYAFCNTVQYLKTVPACKKYVCNATHFFEETHGFSGLLHGPGTMHPCGRAFVQDLVDVCHDATAPYRVYPACGPLGPGDPPRWATIPKDAQMLMASLGWTETAWQKLMGVENLEVGPPPEDFPAVERKCWQDLSLTQQNQLKEIGWNPEGWVSCGYLAKRFRKSCPFPANALPEDTNCMRWRSLAEAPLWGTVADSPLGTYRVAWSALDPNDRANWETLGFTNVSWNTGGFGDFKRLTKEWNELEPIEQTAAKYFQFNLFTWNRCEHMDCLDKLAFAEQFTYPTTISRRWELFTPEFKRWLVAIGWSIRGWSTGEIPIQMTKPWDSADPEVRSVASLLGHTKDTWERCPKSDCLRRLKYLKDKWWPDKNNGEPVDWNLMPQQYQRDWLNLGYSLQTWSEKGKPALYYTSWDSLTDEQRVSARNLGYSMSAWDGCANPSRTEEASKAEEVLLDPFRLVQAKMTIHRSYTEISEGGVVQPAFVEVFRGAVSRTMFCRNEFEKDFEGACYDRDSYERQMDRLMIIRIDPTPVVVHFRISPNRTVEEVPSTRALSNLEDGLEDPDSSIRKDEKFERFARVAKVIEVPFDVEAFHKEQAEIRFEAIRRGEGEVEEDQQSSARMLTVGLLVVLLA